MRVLVTGATGFVGRGLVPALVRDGHDVTCLVRDPARVPPAWQADVRTVQGRAEDPQAVLRAAGGTQAVVVLVHGLDGPSADLVERERRLAAAIREGAELAGVDRLLYLGGLVDEDALATTSTHLYARHQAGVALSQGPVPVTQLRAGIVLGAGSASFELVRAAATAPVRVAAPWSRSATQPIAFVDLLAVLLAALTDDDAAGRTSDIAGPDITTYGQLVERVAAACGTTPLARLRLPYLPPEAVALAAATAAGISPAVALGLLPSARHDAIVRDGWATTRYASLLTTGLDEAIRDALAGSG